MSLNIISHDQIDKTFYGYGLNFYGRNDIQGMLIKKFDQIPEYNHYDLLLIPSLYSTYLFDFVDVASQLLLYSFK